VPPLLDAFRIVDWKTIRADLDVFMENYNIILT